MISPPIRDEELWAYFDGELTPERRAQIEAALVDNRQISEKVAAMRRQTDAVKSIGEKTLDEPVPERLLDVLRKVRVPPRKS